MKIAILGILIGIAAGVIGALCGVGGGIFMVPLFTTILNLTQKQAVATSLAVIVLTALAATLSNLRAAPPLIQWPLFAAATAGAVLTSWFMAGHMRTMTDESLRRIFAAVMVGTGVWMWFSPPPKSEPSAPPAGASGQGGA